jgi:hypothetical protein
MNHQRIVFHARLAFTRKKLGACHQAVINNSTLYLSHFTLVKVAPSP